MYKQKKHTFSKILGTTLALALILGGTVGFLNRYEKPQIGDQATDDEDIHIKNDGVTLKLLSKTENSYGEQDQVFSYSVSPANATNQAVTIDAKYEDGTDCSEVMEASVDETAKTITLSCKGAFRKKINVNVISVDNSSAKSLIIVDYVKKLKSIEVSSINTQLGGTNALSGYTLKNNFALSDNYTVNYSEFTKDKEYRLSHDFYLEGRYTSPEYFANESVGLAEITNDELGNQIYEGAKKLIKDNFLSGKVITDDDVWNLIDSNEYHSWLVSSEPNGVLKLKYVLSVYNLEYNVGGQNGKGNYIAFCFGRDWTGRTVGVDSINAEVTSVEF